MVFVGRTQELSKFRKKSISKSMINEEIEQVKLTGLNCYKYVFFARSGFQAEETQDIEFIGLNELYADSLINRLDLYIEENGI